MVYSHTQPRHAYYIVPDDVRDLSSLNGTVPLIDLPSDTPFAWAYPSESSGNTYLLRCALMILVSPVMPAVFKRCSVEALRMPCPPHLFPTLAIFPFANHLCGLLNASDRIKHYRIRHIMLHRLCAVRWFLSRHRTAFPPRFQLFRML